MFPHDSYEAEDFTGINLGGEDLRTIEFEECTFSKCNFSNSLLLGCEFRGCTFEDCDLSLVKVDHSVFKGVTFKNSKLIGINWPMASWGKKELYQLLKSVDFYDCIMNYSNFFGLDLENIHIENCTALEVDFSEGNFKSASMKGTDFRGSIFRNTNLEKANFTSAKNYAISPTLNELKNAKFSMPEALALLYSMDIKISELYDDDGEDR